MITLRTAAQQALETLEGLYLPLKSVNAAITALRAALAQQDEPVQEPVASLMTHVQSGDVEVVWNDDGFDRELWHETPLYTAPPHCPNCASLEAQNDELDRKLAEMERAEPAAVVGTQVDVWRGCDGRWAPPGEPIKTALMLKDMPVGTMLYTTPPKRQPLSGLEVERLLEQVIGSLPAARNLVRAVERAHGIIEPRIEEDSHQTIDDAMQQPRAMAQAYESGYKSGAAAERKRIIQFLTEMQRVVGDAHNHYGVAAMRIRERV